VSVLTILALVASHSSTSSADSCASFRAHSAGIMCVRAAEGAFRHPPPVAQVDISNVHRREDFRSHSYISDIAELVIAGAGIHGYAFAVQQLIRTLGELTAAP
jgi:3-dehydroquinate dehydratase